MKRVLFTLLGIVLVVGVLAGAGFAGYRMGYMRGVAATNNGTVKVIPQVRDFVPGGLPMHNFERGFNRGFGPGGMGFGMMERGMLHRGGFGFFAPLFLLARVAFWGLIIWLVYKVIQNSGWTLTRKPADAPKVEASAPEDKST